MTGALKVLLCSNTSDRRLYKSHSKSPWSSLTYNLLWDSYFLTPQRVSSRVSSKSIISLLSPQWTFLVVKLIIYLWQFLSNNIQRKFQFSHGVYDQVLFPPVEFFLFTVMSSLSPLNGRNPKLGGFSIGYVYITSELIDSQVSYSSPEGTTPLPLCPVAASEPQSSESSNF